MSEKLKNIREVSGDVSRRVLTDLSEPFSNKIDAVEKIINDLLKGYTKKKKA